MCLAWASMRKIAGLVASTARIVPPQSNPWLETTSPVCVPSTLEPWQEQGGQRAIQAADSLYTRKLCRFPSPLSALPSCDQVGLPLKQKFLFSLKPQTSPSGAAYSAKQPSDLTTRKLHIFASATMNHLVGTELHARHRGHNRLLVGLGGADPAFAGLGLDSTY
jgi:hypothetical protein